MGSDKQQTNSANSGDVALTKMGEFFERFEKNLESWDKNRNGLIDGSEAVQGILSTPKLIAMLMSAIGGVYSVIIAIMGYTAKEINWLALLFGITLVITAIIIYLVIRNTSKGSIKTVSRVVQEHKLFIKGLDSQHKFHYGSLKSRFIDYKGEKELEIEKLHNKIDGLTEQKYQIDTSNRYRGSVIKLIQEQELQADKPKYQHINLTKE